MGTFGGSTMKALWWHRAAMSGTNLLSQLSQNGGDFSSVDLISVGSSAFTLNPWKGNGVSAFVSFNLNDGFQTLGNGKTAFQITTDFTIGMMGSNIPTFHFSNPSNQFLYLVGTGALGNTISGEASSLLNK